MLRPLSVDDLDVLRDHLQSLDASDRAHFHPHPFDEAHLEELPMEPGNRYYLFYDGDVCLGYGMLRTFGEYEVPTLGCVVWEDYRGEGRGTQLVRELIDEAAALGFDRVRLTVHPDNEAAVRAYERVGFEEIPHDDTDDERIWMEVQLE